MDNVVDFPTSDFVEETGTSAVESFNPYMWNLNEPQFTVQFPNSVADQIGVREFSGRGSDLVWILSMLNQPEDVKENDNE